MKAEKELGTFEISCDDCKREYRTTVLLVQEGTELNVSMGVPDDCQTCQKRARLICNQFVTYAQDEIKKRFNESNRPE